MELSLPSSSSSAAADGDVSFGNHDQDLKPHESVSQSAAEDDVSIGDDNTHPKPDDFVNQSALDDVRSGDDSADQPADCGGVSSGDDDNRLIKPEYSVNQPADDDVSLGDDDHLKPDDSAVQSAEDDVSFGDESVNRSAGDDVSLGDNHHLKPDDSAVQSAEDDVSFGDESVNRPEDDYVSLGDNHHLKPDDSTGQSADDDVSFGDDSAHQSAADAVTFGFNRLQINANDDSKSQELMPETDVEDEEEEEDDDDVAGDFTFACVYDTGSPNGHETGQIRTVFPLFDRSLLSGDDYNDGKLKLPIDVPVDKVFVESPSNNGEYAGTVQSISGSPEMKIKSNSTGFSKLWRFKKEMNRSNSDSRDAFVFLESSNRTVGKSIEKVNASGRSTEKVNVTGGKGKAVRKTLNSKKVAVSAHEVYLKQKGVQPEEERRRSYLPYRPGLMGFFTNVNGGLSKNVHPF